MPTYDYECDRCGERSEDFRTVSERNNSSLCKCGGRKTLTVSLPLSPIVYNSMNRLGDGGRPDLQFTGPKDKAVKLKMKGLAEADQGASKDIEYNKTLREKKYKKKMEDTLMKYLHRE